MQTARELAISLWQQHRERAPFQSIKSLLSSSHPGGAYAVQDELVRLMIPSEGEPRGYKIGLTSLRMQQMYGLHEPLAGRLLARRIHRSAARAIGRLRAARCGKRIMRHSQAVVLWLSNHLRGYGSYLRAGDLVMMGSIVPTRFAAAGEHYYFEPAGLAPAELWVN